MLAALLGFFLLVTPADSTDDLDACRSIGPERMPPPVTSLNQARAYWAEAQRVPPDTLESALNRIARARRCYKKFDPSEGGPYVGDILSTYVAEAELYAALREFDQAFDTYEQALAYARSRSETYFAQQEAPPMSWSEYLHQEQGYLHYVLGNLSASIEHYLKAYRLASTPFKEASFLISVGLLHQRTQDYRSAKHYYQGAERVCRKRDLIEDHPSLWARVLNQKADLLLERTLNTEFEREAIEQARDLAERGRAAAETGSDRHFWVSMVLSESLGYLGTFDRAYRINRKMYEYAVEQGNIQYQAFSLLKLGILHIQTEQWKRAASVLSDALALAKDVRHLDYERRILRALGRLHEMRGAWNRAETYYRAGIDVIEEYRSSLTASQWSRTAFAQWRDVHRGLVRTLLAQGRARDALSALDASRARHLQDLRTQARVSNQLPERESVRLDSLSRALTAVRNRLAANSLSSEQESRLQTRETQLMAERQQLLQIESVASRPSIDAIADSIGKENRILVSYFIDDPWPVYDRSPRSAALVLSGNALRTVPLPNITQDSVRSQVDATSQVFSAGEPAVQTNAMHFNLRPLHQLYETLYAPIAERLPPDAPLTVIPDGPLFHVPLSMLVKSMPDGRFAPGAARFVLHERPISFELASSLVAGSSSMNRRRTARTSSRLAAFGVSEFDTLRSVPSGLRSAVTDQGINSSLVLPPLDGVRSELETLRESVSESQVYLNEAATEELFWSVSRKTDILHLASHAFVQPTRPLQNAFLLNSDTRRDTTDGVLFLHELQNKQQPFSLVVLSGCSTARGALVGGEGMEGLQYAFRAMGTTATVASLWPVADRPNAAIMKSFYERLGDGHRKDEALRQAKLEYLDTHPNGASPFFWAPTVLYGSPGPVPLHSKRAYPLWVWWALAATGLVVAGLLVMRWRRRPLSLSFRE